jgi:hypothetical protein
MLYDTGSCGGHKKPYVKIELLIPLGFRTTYGALPDLVGWGWKESVQSGLSLLKLGGISSF